MNKVKLIGRLTKDIELKTYSNVKVVNFSLAVPRTFKPDTVDFIKCTAFNSKAEILTPFKKGKELEIEGSIQTSNFTDKEGKKRYETFVVIDDIKID